MSKKNTKNFDDAPGPAGEYKHFDAHIITSQAHDGDHEPKQAVAYTDDSGVGRTVELASGEEFVHVSQDGKPGNPRMVGVVKRVEQPDGSSHNVVIPFSEYIDIKNAFPDDVETQNKAIDEYARDKLSKSLEDVSDTPAADAIFRKAYEIVIEAEQSQDKYTAREFVGERAKHIKDFEGLEQWIKPVELREKLIDRAKTAGRVDYKDYMEGLGGRTKYAELLIDQFMNRANQMYMSGETDSITVRSFFEYIGDVNDRFHIAFIGGYGPHYSDFVGDKPMRTPITELPNRSRYEHTLDELKKTIPDNKGTSGFVHFNSHSLAPGSRITDRFYISPSADAKPSEVLKIWADTLLDLGLDDKLYYKVPPHPRARYDGIVGYVDTNQTHDWARAIEEFTRRCPKDLLADAMPTGREVSKGVAQAPEPAELNDFLRYTRDARNSGPHTKQESYNTFVSKIVELSMRRALYELHKNGVSTDDVNPAHLGKLGQTYFRQYLKLSGIDPDTMTNA